ncbi:MAG: tetracycline resistance MFS efflux pump, partial [Paracoccaceae bacterium]|nr:tetracycline resistance MFS efflux pump [Paracoccaceae bacterium]
LQGVIASVSALAMGLSPMIMTSVFYFFTRPGAPVYLPGAPFILAAFLMAGCVFILVAGPRAKAPA